ncbi:MAG: hypothetical protein WAT12_06185 [Candidatus Nitrotoga sp.]
MGRAESVATPVHPPTTEQLLVADGDVRIALDPVSGVNRYGCGLHPDPVLAAFGSSTASVISQASFAAADRLRNRLAAAPDSLSQEWQRLRNELITLCGLETLPSLHLKFTSSGTDLHTLVAARVIAQSGQKLLVIAVEGSETGRGVHAALSSVAGVDVVEVPLREVSGKAKTNVQINAEILAYVTAAQAKALPTLLVAVDQSKTGLIAPSTATLLNMRKNFPQLQVLVDACQFRLSTRTLYAYLQQGCLVALTGSKFMGGPAFSGVLCIPAETQLSEATPPPGLLLRWEAALETMRAFHQLPSAAVRSFLQTFGTAMYQRLSADPAFEALPTPILDRRPLVPSGGWDELPTIFPFLLYHTVTDLRQPLHRDETQAVHKALLRDNVPVDIPAEIATLRCQLGQPVACGMLDGVPVSALRLCLSAELVVEALSGSAQSVQTVIARAMRTLDKTAWLTQSGWAE